MDFDSAQIHDENPIANDAELGIAVAQKREPAQYEGAATTRDRHTKKIFVLDRSASMQGTIAAQAAMACIVWPDEFYEWAEQRIQNAAVRVDAEELAAANDDGDDEGIAADSEAVAVPFELDGENLSEDDYWAALRDRADDRDGIRQAVLAHNLQAPFELEKPFRVAKSDLVKAVVARTVRDRVAKYPDADIVGIMFDATPHLVQVGWTDEETGKRRTRNPNPEELIKVVQQDDFGGGGTNITKALGSAVALCRRAPSPVKLHHIILVTDGCDYGVTEAVQYVDTMKERGICLDVIHITESPDEAGELFKDVCARTGGEYQHADNVNDFQTRFLAAASRLMLTAGGAL